MASSESLLSTVNLPGELTGGRQDDGAAGTPPLTRRIRLRSVSTLLKIMAFGRMSACVMPSSGAMSLTIDSTSRLEAKSVNADV